MLKKVYYDNPWLTPVKNYVKEVWRNQGKTNNASCTGMNDFCIIGLTIHPIYYDAWQDEFYIIEMERSEL